MNKYVLLIITNIVALATGLLKFIPQLTAELYGQAIDEIVTQLQASKAQFVEQETEPTTELIEGMVANGLTAVQAGLDSKGDTKYDDYFAEAVSFLRNLGTIGHPVLAAIQTWFQTTFKKKQAAPASATTGTDTAN